MNRFVICHEPVSGAVFVFTYSFIGYRNYRESLCFFFGIRKRLPAVKTILQD